MSYITVPKGESNVHITQIKCEGLGLKSAMNAPEKWNDNTFERFKDNVIEPFTCAIDGYVKAANEMYECLEASLVIGEHILKVCEKEVVGDFSESWILINWVRERMFPADTIDEIWYNFTSCYDERQ